MAKTKPPRVEWLDEAWLISAVIAGMPNSPPSQFYANGWPVSGNGRRKFEELQSLIAEFIVGRIEIVYRLKNQQEDGLLLFDPSNRDPAVTLNSTILCRSKGIKFRPEDLWGFDAHVKLGQILIDRYVSDEWKRQLPLVVASIGGAFTSQTASLNAKQPRPKVDRRSTLAQAVARERKLDPHAAASVVLDGLCGGDVVKELKGDRVYYWSAKGELTSVGLDRYETIFSEQKPSTC